MPKKGESIVRVIVESMSNEGYFQNWVDNVFDSAINDVGEQQLTPELINRITELSISYFKQEIENNIQTYF